MNECVDILLVANAGVLVRTGSLALLVDGVHREDGHLFSRVGEGDLERMRQGEAPFERLDYLLFTHEHPDHFTPGLVRDLTAQRRVKGVFLPKSRGGSAELVRLTESLRERDVAYWPLGLEPGRTRVIEPEEGVRITPFGTRHMGPQFRGVRNDCFLVEVGGVRLLFTGDADPVATHFEEPLRDVVPDAAFVNPIFYHDPAGQAVLNDVIRPREVVVYHLPPRDADPMRLHYSLDRAMQRHGRSGVRIHILSDDAPAFRLCPSGR